MEGKGKEGREERAQTVPGTVIFRAPNLNCVVWGENILEPHPGESAEGWESFPPVYRRTGPSQMGVKCNRGWKVAGAL